MDEKFSHNASRWLVLLARGCLAFAYLFLAVTISVYSGIPDGPGCEGPLAILFSWAALPAMYDLVVGRVAILVPLGYLSLLIAVNTWSARLRHSILVVIPFLIHGTGSLLAIVESPTLHPEAFSSPQVMRNTYVFATLVVAAYLRADFWLANQATATKSPSAQ